MLLTTEKKQYDGCMSADLALQITTDLVGCGMDENLCNLYT